MFAGIVPTERLRELGFCCGLHGSSDRNGRFVIIVKALGAPWRERR